jgi:hypothetical protein
MCDGGKKNTQNQAHRKSDEDPSRETDPESRLFSFMCFGGFRGGVFCGSCWHVDMIFHLGAKGKSRSDELASSRSGELRT